MYSKSLTSSLTISNWSLDCNAVLSNDKQKCMVSAGSVHSFNRDRVRTDSLDEPSTMQNWLKAGVFGLVRLHIENKGQFGVIVQTNLLQILLLAFLQWKINESEWKQVVFLLLFTFRVNVFTCYLNLENDLWSYLDAPEKAVRVGEVQDHWHSPERPLHDVWLVVVDCDILLKTGNKNKARYSVLLATDLNCKSGFVAHCCVLPVKTNLDLVTCRGFSPNTDL